MPTGYTSRVQSGHVTDLRTFAMDCARAFGACADLREDGGGGEIIPDEFKPSEYYKGAVKQATERLAKVSAMTTQDAEVASTAAYASDLRAWEERRTKRSMERDRYKAMLLQVERWQPPSDEHRELKTFMRDQLTESIEFDCSGEYDTPPKAKSAAEWRNDAISEAARALEYATKHDSEEEKRAASRTEWIRALRASLPPAARLGDTPGASRFA